MGMIADSGVGVIRRMHHVGLPMCRIDWKEIQTFWESIGLRCVEHSVERADYDHAGAGARLQVMSGYQLLVSYLPAYERRSLASFLPGFARRFLLQLLMRSMHIAVDVDADMLVRLREHAAFERDTHWGHGLVSVFLAGPYGLHVECVSHDPAFHREAL